MHISGCTENKTATLTGARKHTAAGNSQEQGQSREGALANREGAHFEMQELNQQKEMLQAMRLRCAQDASANQDRSAAQELTQQIRVDGLKYQADRDKLQQQFGAWQPTPPPSGIVGGIVHGGMCDSSRMRGPSYADRMLARAHELLKS